MSKKTILFFGVAVLAAGALGFWGGAKYAPKALSNQGNPQNLQGNQMGVLKNGGNQIQFSGQGKPLTGEIISKDENSLTLKLSDGGSKTVFLSESAKVTKSVEGGAADLESGVNVVVSGKEDGSGNYSAASVQIVAEGSGFPTRLENR